MKIFNNTIKCLKKTASLWNKLKKRPLLVFMIAAAVVSLLYYYHIIAFVPPQSIHRWRQTDCTSITLNYYQHGMKFFQPEVHSLVSDNLTTGYAAGEAPILYYLMAALYRILGPDDTIYRIVNTLIFLTGIGALFKICFHFLKDHFIAASAALLVFTSPVAAYYGCNYLPDSTALAMVFLGWWQFLRHLETKKFNRYLIAVLFFTTAGLLKVTMTINLVALLGFSFFVHLKIIRLPNPLYLSGIFKAYPPILLSLCLIGGWYYYAIRYNNNHDAITFLTSIKPWWIIDAAERQDLTRFIIDNNLNIYFSRGFIIFLAACLMLSVSLWKKIPSYLGTITILLLAGGFIYANLWYSQFQYHDYYFMTLLAPLSLLIITALVIIRNRLSKVFHSWLFRMALLAFLIVNVFHARHEIKLRYSGWKREAPVYEEYFAIRPYLRSIGIKPSDRVISIPDRTSCYTLYMMNQPGNNIARVTPATSDEIRKFIRLGASYLFVNDTTYLQAPELEEFLTTNVGQIGNVHIFRLDSINPYPHSL